MRYQKPYARLVLQRDGSIAFFSSYDPGLVTELKARIPSMARRWNPDEKCWQVMAQYARVCAGIARQHLGVEVEVPQPKTMTSLAATQLLRLEYLGAAKDHGSGKPTAYGWINGGWNVIFPLSVLRNWFEMGDEEAKPDAAITLYGVLGVGREASGIEIKKAHRRAARTWHPDLNKEPEAADQFRRIQFAYETLSNPGQRARYDAGLALTASLKHDRIPASHKFAAHWKSPLRAGYVLVKGKKQLGRFMVSRILQWNDITNERGQILVTYWQHGDGAFSRKWVNL